MAIDGAVPLWLENAGNVYNAREYRRLVRSLYDGREGITEGLAVTQQATPNMSVLIERGACVILGTNSAPNQGSYYVHNDASETIGIAASDPTNPRKDLIVVEVRDSEYTGSNNDARLRVVQGTPAAVPAEPTLPANSIALAMIDVPALSTTVITARITDRRQWVNGWQSYTPSLFVGGTAATPGNGTIVGRWLRNGRGAIATAAFTLGSTTNYNGGSGVVEFSLPVSANLNAPFGNGIPITGSGYFADAGVNTYFGTTVLRSSSRMALVQHLSPAVNFTNTSPFAHGTGDNYTMTLAFEIA
jgi:hypothetical protein